MVYFRALIQEHILELATLSIVGTFITAMLTVCLPNNNQER